MKYDKCIMKFLTTDLEIVDIFLACFTYHLTCGCSSLTLCELKAELITFFSLRNKDMYSTSDRNQKFNIAQYLPDLNKTLITAA